MIVVIGAGITGLAAAYELAARGVPFVLLEASARAGGLILTERAEGFTIEAGPDSFLAQKPGATELCDALGLGPRLLRTTPPRTAYVVKRGRLHALPSPSVLGIPTSWPGLASYDLLPVAARCRVALEPLVPRRRGDVEDESVGAFFRRRFGTATVGLIAEPLLGGIHAGSIDELSIGSLFPRFVEAEARGSVLRAFRRAKAPGAADGLFRSLMGGMSELVAAIERQLPAGSIRYGSPVTAIEPDGSRWRVSTPSDEWRADAVVSAIPARVAAPLVATIDATAGALCAGVPYVSSVSVALAWRREAVRHPLLGSGFVVARRHNDLRITACTWASSKWSGRAPEGRVLLRAFVGGAHDRDAVELADDQLVHLAMADLARVLEIDGDPILTRVHRWRDAGAQHNVGQIARVAEIESRLARHPGLFVAGSGFRSIGIPDCIADGRAAAARACGTIGA